MSKKRTKEYWEMNTEELAEATREFDQPFVMYKARPMTVAERAEELRARRRRGRPAVGKSAKKTKIKLNWSLIRAADRLSRKARANRRPKAS
jgi:hypothetical protein